MYILSCIVCIVVVYCVYSVYCYCVYRVYCYCVFLSWIVCIVIVYCYRGVECVSLLLCWNRSIWGNWAAAHLLLALGLKIQRDQNAEVLVVTNAAGNCVTLDVILQDLLFTQIKFLFESNDAADVAQILFQLLFIEVHTQDGPYNSYKYLVHKSNGTKFNRQGVVHILGFTKRQCSAIE